MKLTVIGHACLHIDTGAERILVDPWLFGSCYWRSWWHFPPNTAGIEEFLEPDYVYLSHHHFDHFHYPSLRRISKKARVLIPRFAVDVMRFELERLGFTDVVEMPHGEPMRLASGARIASYQYGPDDSAIVVERDGVVVADLNDCKIKGDAVAPLLKEFGSPTFLFKSHSFAQAYPNCYRIADPADAQLMTRDDFFAMFLSAIRELRPKHAVPFASMVAFLHDESLHCNQFAVRPPEVAAAVAAAGIGESSVEIMVPGDSWDSSGGFSRQDNDYYQRPDFWIEKLAREHEAKIREEAVAEQGRTLPFRQFEDYFGEFLRSLPPFSSMALKRPVVFFVASDDEPYWVLDFASRRVTRAKTAPANHADVIHIHEAVLADAIEKRVVGFVHISMRIRIDLAPGGVGTDFLFWGLLSVFELGYFPLRNVMTIRAAGVLWRRRAEFLGIARSLLRFQAVDQAVLGNFLSKKSSDGNGRGDA